MRTLLLLLTSVVLLGSSCAAKWYDVSPTTGTSPLNDNNAISCAVAEDLWPVTAGSYRRIHYRLTQGTFTKEDSTLSPAGNTFSFPRWAVPTGASATKLVWASDSAGVGCPDSLIVTPSITNKAPAKPTLQ
jgi:hypothetical protein